MASYHPGVKSLIDRILKQQPTNDKKQKNDSKITNDLKLNTTDKKILDQKLNQNGVNKYSLFKDLLKDRMKEKRRQGREEEDEEDKLNEEYHVINDQDQGTNDDKENLEDEEEEGEDRDDDDADDDRKDSDNDEFILNLDDDEEEDSEKKMKKKKSEKNSKDDDDELFDCNEILDYEEKINNKTSASINDIPASIPSNQLTSNSSITIKPWKQHDEYDFDADNEYDADTTTQPSFRLFIDSTDRQKQKDDDIDCISLNFDTVNNSLNNQNADLSANTANNTASKLNLSENNDLFETECDGQNGEEFDELAMLCSGNFKAVENKKMSCSGLDEEKIDEVVEETNDSDDSVIRPLKTYVYLLT
jgi:hypothetical protein